MNYMMSMCSGTVFTDSSSTRPFPHTKTKPETVISFKNCKEEKYTDYYIQKYLSLLIVSSPRSKNFP